MIKHDQSNRVYIELLSSTGFIYQAPARHWNFGVSFHKMSAMRLKIPYKKEKKKEASALQQEPFLCRALFCTSEPNGTKRRQVKHKECIVLAVIGVLRMFFNHYLLYNCQRLASDLLCDNRVYVKPDILSKNYDTPQSIVLNHPHAQARTCVPHTPARAC